MLMSKATYSNSYIHTLMSGAASTSAAVWGSDVHIIIEGQGSESQKSVVGAGTPSFFSGFNNTIC